MYKKKTFLQLSQKQKILEHKQALTLANNMASSGLWEMLLLLKLMHNIDGTVEDVPLTQEGTQSFLQHTHIPRDKIIALLELVLNNCVFSFQHKLYKQLQGAVMGSPVSPVTANI